METYAEKVWTTWESKKELLRAIERNNKIGEMATMNGNDDIFDRCLERNQIMQQCKREFALHENKNNNSHPSVKRIKNEARDDASPNQDIDHKSKDDNNVLDDGVKG